MINKFEKLNTSHQKIRGIKLPECPRCEDTGKIHYISRFITGDEIEDQWICGSCGNVFREIVHFEGWLLD